MAGGVKARSVRGQFLLNRYLLREPLPSIATLSLQEPETLSMKIVDGDKLYLDLSLQEGVEPY